MKDSCLQVAPQSAQQAVEPGLIVTPCLVGLNVAVFLVMAVSGVSIFSPDAVDTLDWGASFGPLTLGAQPWRAFTCISVHFGIIHLLLNMWCLLRLGKLAEPLLGKWNFLILYMVSGMGGSLLSLSLHPQKVSAGASGAIFGVAGGLVTTLALNRTQIRGHKLSQTLMSMLFFIGYNLLYGLRGVIDNAAHVGGLLSGAALGAFVPQGITQASWLPWMRRALPRGSIRGLDGESAQAASLPTEHPSLEFSRYKCAGAALACVLAAGFLFLRHTTHGSVLTLAEKVPLELYKMRLEDRTDFRDGVKNLRAGLPETAIAELRRVVTHAPEASVAHTVLGEAYNRKHDYSNARAELQKAIALAPDIAVAHANLGLTYIQTGQYADAIQEYHAALRLGSQNSVDHYNLGVALEQIGDFKIALEEYRIASSLDSGNATYKKNYERLRSHGPTMTPAEKLRVEFFKMRPEDRSSLQQAEKLLSAGNTDGAIHKLQLVIAHDPDSEMGHNLLGWAYNQKKQYPRAVQELHKALAVDPDSGAAHVTLGFTLLSTGQYREAIQEYRAAVRLNPENAAAHNNLGVALERTGDFQTALAEYRVACARDPQNPTFKKNCDRLSAPAKSYAPYAPETQAHTQTLLNVTSTPPTAVIYIDGEYKGLAPLTIRLDPGDHKIRISYANCKPYESSFHLSPGETKNIDKYVDCHDAAAPSVK
jgi:Flp pilus assembly protein TadD/membrane associated rhomboid family serine protease